MTGTDGEVVYWRVPTGKVHKRTRMGGQLQALEPDNLDDSNGGAVITAEELSRVELDGLCARCFAREIVELTAAPDDAA